MNRPESAAPLRHFSARALLAALDAERTARGLTWSGVADELWGQSSELNARRDDHPISPSTLIGMGKRSATSCQHALFMLRWLDRSPESFLTGGGDLATPPLVDPGPDRRLRWNLGRLYDVVDARRKQQSLTWSQLAGEIQCTTHQLTGLRTVRFAIGMDLAMRLVQWVQRPAADFIEAAEW